MADEKTFLVSLEQGQRMVQRDSLAGEVGFELTDLAPGKAEARMTVQEKHIAANGFLHAAIGIFFADFTCGLGTAATLPDGDTNFATIDISTTHLGTARQGQLRCKARAAHAGGKTQVWEAEVSALETGKKLILFRCTQVLFARK